MTLYNFYKFNIWNWNVSLTILYKLEGLQKHLMYQLQSEYPEKSLLS